MEIIPHKTLTVNRQIGNSDRIDTGLFFGSDFNDVDRGLLGGNMAGLQWRRIAEEKHLASIQMTAPNTERELLWHRRPACDSGPFTSGTPVPLWKVQLLLSDVCG